MSKTFKFKTESGKELNLKVPMIRDQAEMIDVYNFDAEGNQIKKGTYMIDLAELALPAKFDMETLSILDIKEIAIAYSNKAKLEK